MYYHFLATLEHVRTPDCPSPHASQLSHTFRNLRGLVFLKITDALSLLLLQILLSRTWTFIDIEDRLSKLYNKVQLKLQVRDPLLTSIVVSGALSICSHNLNANLKITRTGFYSLLNMPHPPAQTNYASPIKLINQNCIQVVLALKL